MNTMVTNEKETVLYYNSETSLGKQSLPYTESSQQNIKTIDVSKTKITGTEWANITSKLNITISELVDQNHPDYKKNYGDAVNLSEDDWIKILTANPETLSYSILVVNEDFHLIKSPSQIAKLLEKEDSNFDARNKD
ncbi:arsenate reductase-like glutaredoxin family protein [Lacinutrix venerupis]|uniref:arsenate reductase family protein n=1 Tax=Lacinutrix venerupis TaxID=1486034 RepID=UPI000EB49B54|nr:hypothetical protein [Lacinutrix venerupis]RLJ64479.1 arsenate reductase-like glutaredoxin family protein [Lacinutrix venerupis]